MTDFDLDKKVRKKEGSYIPDYKKLRAFRLADKLRNPLAIAEGYLELGDETGTEDTLKVIAEQIGRLHGILNDLRRREITTFQFKEKLE